MSLLTFDGVCDMICTYTCAVPAYHSAVLYVFSSSLFSFRFQLYSVIVQCHMSLKSGLVRMQQNQKQCMTIRCMQSRLFAKQRKTMSRKAEAESMRKNSIVFLKALYARYADFENCYCFLGVSCVCMMMFIFVKISPNIQQQC